MFVRNIYGDEIIACGYNRSEWECWKCEKLKFRKSLFPRAKVKELAQLLSELDAPAAPASSGDATKAWESTKASEYLCPRCWKLVPENAPCPYCAAPVLDHTECERSKEFLSSCIRSRDERIRQLLAAAPVTPESQSLSQEFVDGWNERAVDMERHSPVTGAQGERFGVDEWHEIMLTAFGDEWEVSDRPMPLTSKQINDARDLVNAALRAAPAGRGLRDNEGTLISEYFRAIVHNIEHLNTETALNTARAGVKALAASEEREPRK